MIKRLLRRPPFPFFFLHLCSCFTHPFLQALFALPVFISSLRCFTQQVRESQQEILQDSLLEVTQQLFESEDPEIRETLIAKFREIFIRNHNQFDNNDMQDAHEFLISLMESLRVRKRNPILLKATSSAKFKFTILGRLAQSRKTSRSSC